MVLGGEYFFRFNNLLEAESVGGGASIIEGTGGFEFARNELIKSQTIRYAYLSCEYSVRRGIGWSCSTCVCCPGF